MTMKRTLVLAVAMGLGSLLAVFLFAPSGFWPDWDGCHDRLVRSLSEVKVTYVKNPAGRAAALALGALEDERLMSRRYEVLGRTFTNPFDARAFGRAFIRGIRARA